jgi:hypothetical protein
MCRREPGDTQRISTCKWLHTYRFEHHQDLVFVLRGVEANDAGLVLESGVVEMRKWRNDGDPPCNYAVTVIKLPRQVR